MLEDTIPVARRETTLRAIQRTVEHLEAISTQWSHPLKQAFYNTSNYPLKNYVEDEKHRLETLRSLASKR